MENQYEIGEEIFELYDIFHNSKSKIELEDCLKKIKSKKDKFDKNSYNYINILHLECITRQRINEFGLCSIDQIFQNLNKALNVVLKSKKFVKNLMIIIHYG